MGTLRRQSTRQTIVVGPLIDATDFASLKTDVAYDAAGISVGVIKEGGTHAAVTLANAAGDGYWRHISDGMYGLTLSASHTDTVGELRVTIKATGVLVAWRDVEIIPQAVYDSLVAGTDRLGVDAQELSGDSAAADNLEAAYDGTGYAGGTTKPDVNVVSIANDAITAAAIKADAVTELQSGLATSANQVTILARLGAWTGSAANTILGAIRALASKAATLPTDIGGTYDPATDSLEAIRDTASGLATSSAVAAVAAVTDDLALMIEDDAGTPRYTQTALEMAPGGAGGIADWTDAEREQIRDALGIDGDTTTAAGGQLQAISERTANLPDSPAATGDAMTLAPNAITAGTIDTDAIGADELAASAVAEILAGGSIPGSTPERGTLYSSIAEVKRHFAQLPADAWGTGKLPSDATLLQIIAAGDALIDDYCRDWYVVPFSPSTPHTIAQISTDLAVAEVRKIIYADGPVPDEQNVVSRRETIKLLERIAQGGPPSIDWPENAAGSASPGGAPLASTPPDAKFSSDQVW